MKKLLLLLSGTILLSACGSGNQTGGASPINSNVNTNTHALSSLNLSAYPYGLATTDFSWGGQAGSGGNTEGWGISSDSSGNVYITGWTNIGISGQKQNV